MTSTIQAAIDESIGHDCIVTISEWTEDDRLDLLVACSDHVEANGVEEFWADEQGDTAMAWRVHLVTA